MRQKPDELIARLYEKHYNNLIGLCRYKLDWDADCAEDCVQEVFLIAAQNAEKLASHPDPDKWLIKTAYHVVMHRKRTDVIQMRNEMPLLSEDKIAGISTDYENIELTDEEIEQIKENMLDLLTEVERETYELRYVRGLSNEEIGAMLGVSAGGIRMRAFRVNLKLRKYLNNIL